MQVTKSEFQHFIIFDKTVRAQQLCRDTDGVIDVNPTDNGDRLTFDVGDTGYTLELASRQVAEFGIMPDTSRVLLRDHAECKRAFHYEGNLKHALIVGIVTNTNGTPVFTFEITKTSQGWLVSGKKFKYNIDKPLPDAVKSLM